MFNLKEGATARRGSLSTAENLPESAILLYSVGSFELWIDQDIGVLFVKVINYKSTLLEIPNDDLWKIIGIFYPEYSLVEKLGSIAMIVAMPKRAEELGQTISFSLLIDKINRSLIVQVLEYDANFIAIPKYVLLDVARSM